MQNTYPADIAGQKWAEANGDFTHRLNYDLNENSIVLDVGGFHGDWASDISNKYNSRIYVFEPIREYYDFIRNRFEGNPRVTVCNYGFSDTDKQMNIVVANSSSSVYKVMQGTNIEVTPAGERVETIFLRNFKDYIKKFNSIDLVKINIEGVEYELLESLDSNDLKILKNIQVQFHQFVEDYTERRKRIREKLSLTHETTYDYEFVWENWRLKE